MESRARLVFCRSYVRPRIDPTISSVDDSFPNLSKSYKLTGLNLYDLDLANFP